MPSGILTFIFESHQLNNRESIKKNAIRNIYIFPFLIILVDNTTKTKTSQKSLLSHLTPALASVNIHVSCCTVAVKKEIRVDFYFQPAQKLSEHSLRVLGRIFCWDAAEEKTLCEFKACPVQAKKGILHGAGCLPDVWEQSGQIRRLCLHTWPRWGLWH